MKETLFECICELVNMQIIQMRTDVNLSSITLLLPLQILVFGQFGRS